MAAPIAAIAAVRGQVHKNPQQGLGTLGPRRAVSGEIEVRPPRAEAGHDRDEAEDDAERIDR